MILHGDERGRAPIAGAQPAERFAVAALFS